MKNVKKILKFVEIQTKVASIIPFSIGTLLALIKHNSINLMNALLMLAALLCIDMATTGLNHYYDNKRAILKSGYHYFEHNPLSSGELSQKHAKMVLIALLAMGVFMGIILVIRTHFMVLIFGGIAFGVGVLYSAGPLPISRTLLGEVFSGFFMGGLIPFIAYTIHIIPEEWVRLNIDHERLTVQLNMGILLPIIFVSLPLMLLIGNIMLANNICDMDEDLINKRYTLPISIGKNYALTLYVSAIVMSYLSVIIAMAFKVMPIHYGLTLITGPLIIKQTLMFVKRPIKAETFKFAVKNFIIFSLGILISLFGIMFL